jgi:hypothetical protein
MFLHGINIQLTQGLLLALDGKEKESVKPGSNSEDFHFGYFRYLARSPSSESI